MLPTYWYKALLAFLVFFIIFLLGYHFQESGRLVSDAPGSSVMGILQTLQRPLSRPVLHEVQVSELPAIRPYACPRNKIPSMNYDWIVCMKRPDDYISGEILNGIWDLGSSTLIMNMVQQYPEATFLDIGCNLGPFSVMIASTKYRVISVDPFLRNLAFLRMSTMLSGSESYVRLIQNTISSHRETLFPWAPAPDNEGGIFFLTEEEAKKKPNEQIVGEGVTSVTLEEILALVETDTAVLKIDVEGSECKALTDYLVEKKQVKFIPYIYMEWVHIKDNNFGLCPDVRELMRGFQLSGYKPIGNYQTNEEISLDTYKTWSDILWVHKDAKPFPTPAPPAP